MFPLKNMPPAAAKALKRDKQARMKREIVVLSVLLHLLFIAFWETTIRLDPARIIPAAPASPARGAPLVFDLQQPEPPREVIATPADARTTAKPQNAEFLSDKNALARNQAPAPAGVPRSNSPFSMGDFESHDLLPQPPAKEAPGREPGENTAAAEKKRQQEASDLPGDETALAAGPRQTETGARAKSPFQLELPGVRHDHRDSQAAESGGLSFNTYDWDFAPYMLALKERISRNIFPPLAFAKLGMIDGDTLLRFKIYPDGRLGDLELLNYTGHRSLMDTSRYAVTLSAPFPNLPADFPKSYLEVTAKFSYIIKK